MYFSTCFLFSYIFVNFSAFVKEVIRLECMFLSDTTCFNLMFIGPCIIAIIEGWKTNLMSLAILFHFLCAQHVSDINISIIRSLRLCCWITTSVVFFSVRCVLEILCGWFWVVLVSQAEAQLVLQPAKRAPSNSYTVLGRGAFSSICIIQLTTRSRWKFTICTYTMIMLCIVFLYIYFCDLKMAHSGRNMSSSA